MELEVSRRSKVRECVKAGVSGVTPANIVGKVFFGGWAGGVESRGLSGRVDRWVGSSGAESTTVDSACSHGSRQLN